MSQQSNLLNYFQNPSVKNEPQSQTPAKRSLMSEQNNDSAAAAADDDAARSPSNANLSTNDRLKPTLMSPGENKSNASNAQPTKRVKTESISSRPSSTASNSSSNRTAFGSTSAVSARSASLSAGASEAIAAQRQQIIDKSKTDTASDIRRRAKYAFLDNPRDQSGNYKGTPNYDPSTVFIPQESYAEFTSFEKQYWDIKRLHFDTIIFFRKGKFYELFENDADIGCKALGLRVTNRGSMRLAGVPVQNFIPWAKKLIEMGYKIGRVDELESRLSAERRKQSGDLKNVDAIMKRQLVQILTPGTLSDEAFLATQDANHLFVLVEWSGDVDVAASGAPVLHESAQQTAAVEYAVCYVDCTIGTFRHAHLHCDARRLPLQTLLMHTSPKEVVVLRSHASRATLHLVQRCLRDVQVTRLDSRDVNELLNDRSALVGEIATSVLDRDLATLQQAVQTTFFARANNTLPQSVAQLSRRPLCAIALCLAYLKQCKLAESLINMGRFVAHVDGDMSFMSIDGQSLLNLDILKNSVDLGRKGTLLSLLDQTITSFGKRQLHQWLCLPLASKDAIEERLSAVDDLRARAPILRSVISMLNGLPDIERLLTRVHQKTANAREFLTLISAFERIEQYFADRALDNTNNTTDSFESSFLKELFAHPPPLAESLKRVRATFKVIKDESKKDSAPKVIPMPGSDDDYDRCSQTLQSFKTALQEELEEARRTLNDASIQFLHNASHRFQLQVSMKTLNKRAVPADWILISQTKAVKRYHTRKIQATLPHIEQAQEELNLALQGSLLKLLDLFAQFNAQWHNCLTLLKTLDCLVALCRASQQMGNVCRPSFIDSEKCVIDIKNGRHPCLAQHYAAGEFIPNSIELGVSDNSASRMILLTGPNMGGKSTVMRQTCVLIILAQIGCYVPATHYKCSVVDRVFTRIGAHDNILAGQSTFMVELEEASNILRLATPRSFVILDELGRGTSTHDGYSIACATLRHLSHTVECGGMFATHYHQLTDEFQDDSAVRRMHMKAVVDSVRKRVTFLYKIVDGVCPKSYGMHVARMADIPSNVVDQAEIISDQLETLNAFLHRVQMLNK